MKVIQANLEWLNRTGFEIWFPVVMLIIVHGWKTWLKIPPEVYGQYRPEKWGMRPVYLFTIAAFVWLAIPLFEVVGSPRWKAGLEILAELVCMAGLVWYLIWGLGVVSRKLERDAELVKLATTIYLGSGVLLVILIKTRFGIFRALLR